MTERAAMLSAHVYNCCTMYNCTWYQIIFTVLFLRSFFFFAVDIQSSLWALTKSVCQHRLCWMCSYGIKLFTMSVWATPLTTTRIESTRAATEWIVIYNVLCEMCVSIINIFFFSSSSPEYTDVTWPCANFRLQFI